MIAKRRRVAAHDFLLVAFSVAVIVLSCWPKAEPRQIVKVRDAADQPQHYSFRVDDPRLALLQRELARDPRRSVSTSLAKAKWYAETAGFYADLTAAKASRTQDVVRVSFNDGQPAIDTSEADALLAEHKYWSRIREQTESQIAAAEKSAEQQRSVASPPRIVVGPVTRGHHPPYVFALAGVIGLLMAGVFACWTYVCPAIGLEPALATSDSLSSDWDSESELGELRLAIQSHWVRLHQPASVIVRRTVFAAIVAGGFVSLF